MYNVIKHGVYVIFTGTESECYEYIDRETNGLGAGFLRVHLSN